VAKPVAVLVAALATHGAVVLFVGHLSTVTG
jgi:hypothetical protein